MPHHLVNYNLDFGDAPDGYPVTLAENGPRHIAVGPQLGLVRFRDFDEPIDGLIYASFIGLGYAAVENIHYLDFLTPLESAARSFTALYSSRC